MVTEADDDPNIWSASLILANKDGASGLGVGWRTSTHFPRENWVGALVIAELEVDWDIGELEGDAQAVSARVKMNKNRKLRITILELLGKICIMKVDPQN